MPSKRANVKNEKQYEALKEKGMSKERAARIANSPGSSLRGGQEVRVRRRQPPGRHDRAEEGRGPQGRKSRGQEEVGRRTPPSGGSSAGILRQRAFARSASASVPMLGFERR